MVHKAGNRGTFIIDRRTRVGRIAVASGTKHAPTFRRLNEMITTLNETGRDDILRALREGELSPLSVYDAFRTNELHRLPTGVELKPLKESLEAWLENVDCSKAQRAAHKTMITKVLAMGLGTTINQLPGRLVLIGLDCRKAKHPAQFNRVRASSLAFIRDTLKRSHRLHGEIRDIPIMKEKKSPERHVLSWADVQELAPKFKDVRDRRAFYGMYFTGMGPKEWYIDGWQLEPIGVRIRGQKRSARGRLVPAIYGGAYYAGPLVDSSVGLQREKRRFGERLLALAQIHPYDLRRSYANLLEASGVPRTRRRLYMGHARQDVTDIYEENEVRQFLAEDARRIEAYLASAPTISHITISR